LVAFPAKLLPRDFRGKAGIAFVLRARFRTAHLYSEKTSTLSSCGAKATPAPLPTYRRLRWARSRVAQCVEPREGRSRFSLRQIGNTFRGPYHGLRLPILCLREMGTTDLGGAIMASSPRR